MLSMNKLRINITLCGLLIALFPSSVGYAEVVKDNYVDHFNNLSEMFRQSDDHETGELLGKWSDYLANMTTHNNSVYLSAIQHVITDYYGEIISLSDCIKTVQEAENRKAPDWLDDLTQRFGKNFVKSNEKAILTNLRAIIANSTERVCGDVRQKLIYKEARVHSAYKHYFNQFLKFYESLGAEEQEKLRYRKKAAESFMNLLEYGSFYRLFFDAETPRQILTDIEAREHNIELYDFFKNHPIALQRMNISKAVDDLKKLTRADD